MLATVTKAQEVHETGPLLVCLCFSACPLYLALSSSLSAAPLVLLCQSIRTAHNLSYQNLNFIAHLICILWIAVVASAAADKEDTQDRKLASVQ